MLSRYDVYSPLSPFWPAAASPLESTVSRLFADLESAFTRSNAHTRSRPGARGQGVASGRELRARGPRIQLRDRGDGVSLVADLPGLSLADIDLAIEGETVTLKAVAKTRPAPEGFTALRRERQPTAVEWSFELPYAIDAATATATLEQGRLLVMLPKAPAAKPRVIPVKAA